MSENTCHVSVSISETFSNGDVNNTHMSTSTDALALDTILGVTLRALKAAGFTVNSLTARSDSNVVEVFE